MKITSDVFHAYLKCPTKCWLRATHELAAGSNYSVWVKAQNCSYRTAEAARLVAASPKDEIASSPDMKNVKNIKWRLATSLATNTQMDTYVLESELHAVQFVPAQGRGLSTQLIPIRFIFTNKIDKDDKLLLAFDAFVLSKSLGRKISFGKIIHGDDHATSKVNTSALANEVRKRIEKIVVLLGSSTPPDLILNRHCAECEFRTRCDREATQQDDLSLLSGMTGIERKKLNSKGTFTVKQLSFAFLPRRRPKKSRDKRERYHHSLKALAIREQKLHIAGCPELRIEGTPVFFDVEGLPDRDFYYLIGLRIRNGDSVVQHSLWADTSEDEGRIYSQFLNILKTIENPALIHYGSFETSFLMQMGKRYGISIQDVIEDNGNHIPTNLLSVINGQVYFPTYSNSLKSIARWLGFEWSDASLTGIESIAYRCNWELCHDSSIKTALIEYNAEDCKSSVKRWVARCRFHYYWCSSCYRKIGEPHEFWPQSHLGRTLVAYVLYQTFELCIPFPTVRELLLRCFKLDILLETLITVKTTAARQYKATYEAIFRHLVSGSVLHVDETQVSIKGCTAYVWVFTNFHDVAYLYTENREGVFLQEMLKDFKGVLVTDFFSAYDAIGCDQQKCLIHLIRDLNDSVLKHPYDEDLKLIVREVAALLKPIVDTIDDRGLKKRFLRKHQFEVARFYRKIAKLECRSEQAIKCRQRFEKYRDKLFTFLDHDDIPWHNNNAEHAIKAFAKLRDISRGSFTERTVKNSLILLSICQTCKYSDLDFFEFLRAGETDIYGFAERLRGRNAGTIGRAANSGQAVDGAVGRELS
jgi:predicted RecB family nuclease